MYYGNIIILHYWNVIMLQYIKYKNETGFGTKLFLSLKQGILKWS